MKDLIKEMVIRRIDLFTTILIALLVGCTTTSRQTLSSSTVTFAPNAWIRGVSSEDINYVHRALSMELPCKVDGAIVSLGKGKTPEGEQMIAYTQSKYFEFIRKPGGSWHFTRCGSYAADTLPKEGVK